MPELKVNRHRLVWQRSLAILGACALAQAAALIAPVAAQIAAPSLEFVIPKNIAAVQAAETPFDIELKYGDKIPKNSWLEIVTIPPSITLSAGTLDNGIWHVRLSDVPGLRLKIPANVSGDGFIYVSLIDDGTLMTVDTANVVIAPRAAPQPDAQQASLPSPKTAEAVHPTTPAAGSEAKDKVELAKHSPAGVAEPTASPSPTEMPAKTPVHPIQPSTTATAGTAAKTAAEPPAAQVETAALPPAAPAVPPAAPIETAAVPPAAAAAAPPAAPVETAAVPPAAAPAAPSAAPVETAALPPAAPIQTATLPAAAPAAAPPATAPPPQSDAASNGPSVQVAAPMAAPMAAPTLATHAVSAPLTTEPTPAPAAPAAVAAVPSDAPSPVTASTSPDVKQPIATSAPTPHQQRLIAQGERNFADGNISIAREYFEAAAALGSAMGAFRLAETNDPYELEKAKVVGLKINAAEAMRWYGKAAELGMTDATERMQRLKARQPQ